MSNFRQTRVAEANKKLARAITRAHADRALWSVNATIDATVGKSPTGAAGSPDPSTSAGRSRTKINWW